MTPTHATTLIVTCAAGREGDARRELARALGAVRVEALFLKGNLLAHTPLGEEEALQRLRDADTRFVARATPVQTEVQVDVTPDSTGRIAQAALALGRVPPGATFVVRCHRRGTHEFRARDVERAVGLLLEGEVPAVAEFRAPAEHTVSVEIFQDRAYVGVSPSALLVRKELRNARRYAPGERPLNRAQHKLREALTAFEIQLQPNMRALDLGAAPGGWSAVLADHGCTVVAVDKGELAPEVAQHPAVTHLRTSAQEALEQDLDQFDVIVNDMNLDPQDSARLMCAFAQRLRPGAIAIMTIKFVTAARRRHEAAATEILAERYDSIRVRRLPHNRFETTVAMRRR